MKQLVKCGNCGAQRTINRKRDTHPCYSFWCTVSGKEVAQDRDFRIEEDKKHAKQTNQN